MRVTRIDISILGERGYPLVLAHLSEEQSKDFSVLYELALSKNPAAIPDDVIRAIWRYGVRQTQKNLVQGIPLKTEALPGPLVPKSEHGIP